MLISIALSKGCGQSDNPVFPKEAKRLAFTILAAGQPSNAVRILVLP